MLSPWRKKVEAFHAAVTPIKSPVRPVSHSLLAKLRTLRQRRAPTLRAGL